MNERQIKYWHTQMTLLDEAVEKYWTKRVRPVESLSFTDATPKSTVKVIVIKPSNRRR